MKKFFLNCFVMCLLLLSNIGNAQVGINTTNPHPSAALDVTAIDKGLLIPRLTTAARVSMVGMANSLLVFDTDLQLFFYYQAANAKWYSLNAWQSEVTQNGGNTDTITTTYSSVGIGTSVPTKRLEVVGDIKVSDSIYVGTSLIAGNSISAPKIYGEGTMPVGAIIMWSGAITALPAGWALCDGDATGLHAPQVIPNLSGRFVVGYDAADTDYNATNKVGPSFTDADGASTGANTTDAKQVRLTGGQSGVAPHTHSASQGRHNHSYNDFYQGDKTVGQNGGGNGEQAGSNDEISTLRYTDFNTPIITIDPATATSANQSIENRPPYFVLAYIIKLNY